MTMLDADGVKHISNIRFTSITSESRLPIRLNGLEDKPIENIWIANSTFRRTAKLDTKHPVPAMYWNQKAYDHLPQIEHVRNLHLSDVSFDW